MTLASTSRPEAAPVPDLRACRRAGPLVVYADARRSGLFFYPPGQIGLTDRPDGSPGLLLLQARHARDTASFRSRFTFRLRMSGPSPAELGQARAALRKETGRAVELRPLAIRRTEAAVVYLPVDSACAVTLPDGSFEAAGPEGADGVYWTERSYTIRLDRWSAKLYTDALRRGPVAMSLGFAFYAEGIAADTADELSGSPEVVAALRRQLARAPRGVKPGSLVQSCALALTVDPGRWPDTVRQIDLDAVAPPGFAALGVRCYDFRDELRPDLYAKQIDLEAEGGSGRTARITLTFDVSRRDLSAVSARFPYSVRMNRPFRYRVREILDDGTRRDGDWISRESWADVIDITSRFPVLVLDDGGVIEGE